MKNLIITFTFIFSSGISTAQKLDTQKLDSLFQILAQNDKFMGSISISHQQKTIYSNTIGFSDVEKDIKATPHTKYRIGSATKMFTATLIFKAIEENKLTINQSIKQFFPGIENADKISIKNLLNHSSGIYDFTHDEGYFNWSTKPQSESTMLSRILKGKSQFRPGSKNKYSNSNYFLLTLILEDVYGEPYDRLLEDEIIKPLNLKNTYYGRKTNTSKNESLSYKYLGKWKKVAETDMSVPRGAGAIVSNPTDLNIFLVQLFLGKIISKESLELMKTIENGYGLGLFNYTYGNRWSYGHTGRIDGFQSWIQYFPEENLAISLVSNGVNYSENKIIHNILDDYFNNQFEMPSFNNMKLSSKDLDKYLGTYSSKEIPPKIKISKEDSTLIAQATGQSAFPLEPNSKDTFIFEKAGVELEFFPKKEEMIMKQGGNEFLFSKE